MSDTTQVGLLGTLIEQTEAYECDSDLKSCRVNWPTDPASWCDACLILALADAVRALATLDRSRMTGRRHEGKWQSWSSLEQAVLWMPLPAPPLPAPEPEIPYQVDRMRSDLAELRGQAAHRKPETGV